MWKYHCIPMLLLGLAFVNSAPVQDENTGFENDDESTGEYDTYTGYFTYRGNSDLVNNNHLSTSLHMENKPDNPLNNDKDSSEEEESRTQDNLQTSEGTKAEHSKTTYTSSNPRKLQLKKYIRPTTVFKYHCPVGQIYQSELSICIDYPLGPLLPTSGIMLSDAPVMMSAANQRAPSSVIKLTKVKIDINHGCQPSETYISELDICFTEAPQRASASETMLSDAPARVSAANQRAPSTVIKLTKLKIDINHGCKPNEIYMSELDICYPMSN